MPALQEGPVHVVICASDKIVGTVKPGQSFLLGISVIRSSWKPAEREQRRLENSKPRDFTAPSPIQSNNTVITTYCYF